MNGLLIIFLLAWYGSGFWGLLLLWRKHRLAWFTNLGCTMWLLFGWVLALVVLCIPLALGPITLLIGLRADDRSPGGLSAGTADAGPYVPRRTR